MNEENRTAGERMLDAAIEGLQRLPVPAPPALEVLCARIPPGTPASAARTVTVVASADGRRWRGKTWPWATVPLSVALIGCLWVFLAPSAPLALAEVIQSTTKHQLVRCKIHQVAKFNDEFKDRFIGDAVNDYTMYTDLKQPRLRLEEPTQKTLSDLAEQSSVSILDYRADRFLTLYQFDVVVKEEDVTDDDQKELLQSIDEKVRHRREAIISRPQTGKNDVGRLARWKPYSDLGKEVVLLDTLRSLQNETETVSSVENLKGRVVTKYRLKKPDLTSTVWVDSETKLPLQIEYILVGEHTGKQLESITWTYTDFEWDPSAGELDQLFSTTPPEKYEVKDLTQSNN
jgi:hypothetical protein